MKAIPTADAEFSRAVRFDTPRNQSGRGKSKNMTQREWGR